MTWGKQRLLCFFVCHIDCLRISNNYSRKCSLKSTLSYQKNCFSKISFFEKQQNITKYVVFFCNLHPSNTRVLSSVFFIWLCIKSTHFCLMPFIHFLLLISLACISCPYRPNIVPIAYAFPLCTTGQSIRTKRWCPEFH